MTKIEPMKVVRWRSGVKHISADGKTTVCGHTIAPDRSRVVADTTDWPRQVTCYNCAYRNTPPGYLQPRSSADFPLRRACAEHPGWPQGQCVKCGPAQVLSQHFVRPARRTPADGQRCPGQGENGCESRERVLHRANPDGNLDLADSAMTQCYHCGHNVCVACQMAPVDGPLMFCTACAEQAWNDYELDRIDEQQQRADHAKSVRASTTVPTSDWPDHTAPDGAVLDEVVLDEAVLEVPRLDERWVSELGLSRRPLVPAQLHPPRPARVPGNTSIPERVQDARSAATEALTQAVRECARTIPRSEPGDAAALIAEVVTATVANLGSLDAVQHSAGSVQMGRVREMVGTTTSGGDLLNWRSEMLHVYVDPREVFESFGLDHMHEADLDAAFDLMNSARRAALQAAGIDPERPWLHGPDDADTPQVKQAAALVEEIEEMYRDDEDNYVEAYAQTVASIVVEHSLTVRVMVHKGDRDEMIGGYNTAHDGTAHLHRLARERTPLPQLGRAPTGVDQPIADAVRAARRTYAERAHARL